MATPNEKHLFYEKINNPASLFKKIVPKEVANHFNKKNLSWLRVL